MTNLRFPLGIAALLVAFVAFGQYTNTLKHTAKEREQQAIELRDRSEKKVEVARFLSGSLQRKISMEAHSYQRRDFNVTQMKKWSECGHELLDIALKFSELKHQLDSKISSGTVSNDDLAEAQKVFDELDHQLQQVVHEDEVILK